MSRRQPVAAEWSHSERAGSCSESRKCVQPLRHAAVRRVSTAGRTGPLRLSERERVTFHIPQLISNRVISSKQDLLPFPKKITA